MFNTHPHFTCLTTRDIAPGSIKTALLTAKTHGEDNIKEFTETRLLKSEVVFNVRLVEYKRDPKQKGKTINADKVVFVAGSHFCGFPSRCPSNVNKYTCTSCDRLFIID